MKKNYFFDFAFALIMFIFMNILISTTLFIFKCSISGWNFILALILTIISYYFLMKRNEYSIKKRFVCVGIFCFIIFFTIFISGKIYDISFDANTYHKVAIGELKNGWNPLYESLDEFNQSNKNFHLPKTNALWVDHYGKAQWIYASNVYKITNNIEAGKSFSLLLIVITFLICFSFFENKISKKYNYILSFLLSMNPIMLCQMTTFYNDGILGNLLIILIISLTIMVDCKKTIPKLQNYILYFFILCILMNIKFTGFAFAGVYSLLYYLYFIFDKEQRTKNLKLLTITAIVSLVVGIGIIGLSTYPKNMLDHGNPFYPLYGKGKVDIMTMNTPTGFHDMNPIKKFLVANFSQTSNPTNNGIKLYQIKIPFTFKTSEIEIYKHAVDVRIGGYGVLFGGILLLSFGCGLYCLYRYKKDKIPLIRYLLPILGTIALIVVLEESWWARYLPQVYALPIIVVIMLDTLKKSKIIQISQKIIIVLLIMNTYLLINPVMEGIYITQKKIASDFAMINHQKSDPIIISTSKFSGAIFNVIDRYPNFKVASNCEEAMVHYVLNNRACIYKKTQSEQ